MSAHVAPHRWADAWAGKVGDAERVMMDRHAESCSRCSRQRDRVTSASNSYSAIRTQAAPEVAWDAVRARVHWSVSSERRSRSRTYGRGFAILAWSALAAGSVALGLVTGDVHLPKPRELAVVPTLPPRPIANEPAKLSGLVSRLAGEVMIDGIRASGPAGHGDAFVRTIGAGTLITTADGRIDVQFGEHSAFAIGARSSLEIRRFDAQLIELAIEGTVDIEVAPRAYGQRFLVIAGDQTIEVRGTQFRVVHAGANTKVACRHGLVAVRDAHTEVEVAAARSVDVHAGVGDASVVAMTKDELAQLVLATPHTLPVWSDAESLSHNSAPLEVATVGRRDIRVDGVELGEAPLRVRVMPGRHTIEAIDGAGRFRRAGWVDVDTSHVARLVVTEEDTKAPPLAPNPGVAQRQHQLLAGLDRAELKQCTRRLAKQGLTDTFVTFEISVETSGDVSLLNIENADLPLATQSCIHDVLSSVRFATGPSATWHQKLDL
ncbi:MAG: hypothetical protein JWO36_5926 [Myxococcales bacterium]|nr:hypothetical protein [Myxococcales bacterium]